MARVIVVRSGVRGLIVSVWALARTRYNVVYAQSRFWEFHFGYLGCPVLDMYRMDFGGLFSGF